MPPQENFNRPTPPASDHEDDSNCPNSAPSLRIPNAENNSENVQNNLVANFISVPLDFPAKKAPNIVQADSTSGNNVKNNNNNGGAECRAVDCCPTMDFDDLLPYIGEFGFYQKTLFLLMIPFAFSVAFVYFTQIFITVTPDKYWCRVPDLANLTVEQRKALSIPKSLQSDGQFGYDQCSMYNVDYAKIVESGENVQVDPTWPVSKCQHGWEFDFSDVPYSTIATELEWVCDKSALPSTAQAIFFCGAILGGLVFGWIADRYGRMPALIGSNVVGFVAGIGTAFVGSFWTFCVCRFFVGMAFDNCFTMIYILVLEYVGPQWRTFVANMSIAIFFTLASSTLPWIAYFIADWKLLCIVTSLPLVAALGAPWLVPESARWLISQGKIDKALTVLKRFERINGSKIDPKIYQDFTDSCHRALKEEQSNRTYSVLDLFKSPRLRNITILLIVIWMIVSLCFDGHVRNVGSLGLDLFLTFTIASATEFPADTFLTVVLDKWGRRWLACGTMIISGIFSLLATVAPVGIWSASLAIMGRFSVNISYNIGLQYAAEVLPTVVRAQGVALIHIMGYVASIVSPFVVYIAYISPALPLLILGGLGIIGGVLCLFLPETLDQDLPQTLQDGEEFGKDQKLWDFPCCGKSIEEDSVGHFRRTNTSVCGGSIRHRASFRGGIRSSMINRSPKNKCTINNCLPEC